MQILALVLLRQRAMRLTIISILEDLAFKLPPARANIDMVRLQFARRFKHEDIMMQQITPPGFNPAEKVCMILLSPAGRAESIECIVHNVCTARDSSSDTCLSSKLHYGTKRGRSWTT